MFRLGTIGIAFSLVYLVAIAYFQWDRLHRIGDLELNAFGDFLAGTFGPLAIFWLILGFFLQSRELKASVDALKLQSRELAQQIEVNKEELELHREEILRNRTANLIVSPNLHIFRSGVKIYEKNLIFEIVNFGGACAHAEVMLRFEDGEILKFKKIDYWKNGEHHSINLQLSLNSTATGHQPNIEQFKGYLELQYFDQKQGHRRLFYRVEEDLNERSVFSEFLGNPFSDINPNY